MTLAKELEDLKKQAAIDAPAEVTEAFQNAIQDWIASGIDRNALKTGDRIPSFQLNDATGETVSSDELLKQGPIIISFYRGGWCPWCSLELRALQKHLSEFKNHNATLVAISPELPDSSSATIEKNDLKFPVLTDRNLLVAKQFGLVFQLPQLIEDMTKNVFDLDLTKINGTEKFELPIPATFVVDSNQIIRHAFVDADFMKRAEPSMIVEVLKNLN